MASVEEQVAAAPEALGIAVENPATGRGHRPRPRPRRRARWPSWPARGRAAQPAWEALGFEGRGRILRRMQKWLVDNSSA